MKLSSSWLLLFLIALAPAYSMDNSQGPTFESRQEETAHWHMAAIMAILLNGDYSEYHAASPFLCECPQNWENGNTDLCIHCATLFEYTPITDDSYYSADSSDSSSDQSESEDTINIGSDESDPTFDWHQCKSRGIRTRSSYEQHERGSHATKKNKSLTEKRKARIRKRNKASYASLQTSQLKETRQLCTQMRKMDLNLTDNPQWSRFFRIRRF